MGWRVHPRTVLARNISESQDERAQFEPKSQRLLTWTGLQLLKAMFFNPALGVQNPWLSWARLAWAGLGSHCFAGLAGLVAGLEDL